VTPGAVVLVIAVVAALVFGLWRALTDGRFRGTHRVRDAAPVDEPAAATVLVGTQWESQLGDRATLLQFSSAFCAPCRATRRILDDVAGKVPGVAHIEVDAEHHLEMVRRLGILRTPTTLILDAAGHEIARATGAPTRQQVLAAVGVGVSE
jgi:thiol-disulfide isomerase/thioredoxin